MTRASIFLAVKQARSGASYTPAEVSLLDKTLDDLRVPRDTPTSTPTATSTLTQSPHPQIGLTLADFTSAASRLKCAIPQIHAVDEVESGGGWFADVRQDILNLDGPGGFIAGPNLPKILFEAHIFNRYTGGKYLTSHPNLASKSWNRSLYVGGQGEWTRLHNAMQLDQKAALLSASVGRYQIMGFNHVQAGFPTVQAFWDAQMLSEVSQLQTFTTFILNSAILISSIRKISTTHADCIPFASAYNGSAYAANNYHVKLARAFAKFS